MVLWQMLCVIGIAFIILEICTPSMFFLNFALASFITAFVSVYSKNHFLLVLIFFAFSFISFVFLRPLLIRKNSKTNKTGVEGKYIGKTAKAIAEITENSGAISIYDERWEARTILKESIPEGSEVRIVKNESLVMYVEKVN